MTKIITELESAAAKHGVQVKEVSPGHFHLIGKLLVNYWPTSKRRTAYVTATREGRERVTPKEAVQMALQPPPLVGTEGRRKHRARDGAQFKNLWYRQNGLCCWCREPMLENTDPDNPLRASWEHKIPLARGGLDNPNNLALAHKKCNNDRGHNMPELKE